MPSSCCWKCTPGSESSAPSASGAAPDGAAARLSITMSDTDLLPWSAVAMPVSLVSAALVSITLIFSRNTDHLT
eukprot:7234415-Pyramimonas_sp.AAC.1